MALLLRRLRGSRGLVQQCSGAAWRHVLRHASAAGGSNEEAIHGTPDTHKPVLAVDRSKLYQEEEVDPVAASVKQPESDLIRHLKGIIMVWWRAHTCADIHARVHTCIHTVSSRTHHRCRVHVGAYHQGLSPSTAWDGGGCRLYQTTLPAHQPLITHPGAHLPIPTIPHRKCWPTRMQGITPAASRWCLVKRVISSHLQIFAKCLERYARAVEEYTVEECYTLAHTCVVPHLVATHQFPRHTLTCNHIPHKHQCPLLHPSCTPLFLTHNNHS